MTAPDTNANGAQQKLTIASGDKVVTTMTAGQALVLASDTVEVQGMTMDKAGELIIQLSDGASVTIKNFADIAHAGGSSFITLPSGQTVNLAELIQTLAPAAQDGTQVADATPTQQVLASEHPAQTAAAAPASGPVVIIDKPHAHENVVVKLLDGDEYKLGFNMTDPSSVRDQNGELVISFKDGGEVIIPNYDAMKTAHMPDFVMADGTTLSVTDLGDTLAQAAQLTSVEPAAGGNGGGGGGGAHGGGFGFGSVFTADEFHNLNPVGPIGETELNYGIFDHNPIEFAVIDHVDAPALAVENVFVTEDGNFAVAGTALSISSHLVNPSAGDHLVITVSGIAAGWTVNTSVSGGTYDAAHGTWTITLPAGASFTGGPTLTPPTWTSADLTGLVVTATATDGVVSASTSGTESVTIVPIADPVPITAPDDTGNQNTSIATPITLTLPEGVLDGADHITNITIGGVPAGMTLNHGTLQSNGTWILTQADLTGLTITPTQWFHGDIPLSVTVTDTITTLSGHTNSAVTNDNFTVHVLDTIVAPALTTQNVSVTEDGNFAVAGTPLVIAANLVNPSPTEQLTVTVTGIAAGWTVDTTHSGGTYTAATGTWTVTLAPGQNFSGGPTLTPPSWTSADLSSASNPTSELTVTATASDGTLTASTTGTESVTIVPVADPVPITAPDDTGNQNTAIATPITLTLPEGVIDGADHISSIVISGVPAGATLNHGALQLDGTWLLTQGDLTGLTIKPPQWFTGNIPLSVQVTDTITTDSGHTASAVTNGTFTVHVLDTILAPALTTQNVSVTEDGNFAVAGTPLVIAANLVNPSPTEQLTVTVTGIAAGWTVDTTHSGGTYTAATGTWTVTLAPGQNFSGGPTLTPPSWTSADLTGLQVTATASDGTLTATTTGTETVTIVPIADPVPITSPDASGNENATIPLSISLSLPQGVTDGADHITSIVIGGVPAGATLNHGVLQSNGTWILAQGDLTGLTITPPSHFIGDIPLSVQVTDTITTLSGHTASAVTNSTLTVDVLHQGPTISASATPDATYEANLHATGTTSVSDAVTAHYFDGDTGAVTATGAASFAASGALENGVLTSEGAAVTVTESGNTYVGTAGGHEVFSLQLQANGQYTFTLDAPLDQTNVNGHATGPIDLAFGATATDSDGYSASTTINVLDYDDAPVANSDVNVFNADLGAATGNVITGLNGGPGAADTLSVDAVDHISSVSFGSTTVDVPTTGTATIAGADGVLTISSDGSYTYTHDAGSSSGGTAINTPHTFTGNSFPTDLSEGQAISVADQADLGEIHSNMAIDANTQVTGQITFDGAGYTNSLGAFTIAANGTLEAVQMVAPSITGTGASFNIDATAGAQELGFFLVANGFNTNNGYAGMDFSKGTLSFVYDYGQSDARAATVNDQGGHVSLVFTEGSTSEVIGGPIWFTTDRGGSNSLNSDGVVHTISGVGANSNTLNISFEDLPGGGDKDYNDAEFSVQLTDHTTVATTPDVFQYTLEDGDGSTSTANLTLDPNYPVLAPALAVQNVSVTEDGNFAVAGTPLSIAANLVSPSPTEQLTVTVSGIASGWTVDTTHSGGSYNAATGTWTVTLAPGQSFAGGPTLTPPSWTSADLTGLTVTATATDNGVSVSTTGTESVTIVPVADPVPIITPDDTGAENTAVPVAISLTLPQGVQDGADHISSIVISGVPSGAALNHGTLQSNGTWVLTQGDLTGLTLTPAGFFHGDIPLSVTVTDTTITLSGHTASAVTTSDFTVHVQDTICPPALNVHNVSVTEDGNFAVAGTALSIAANLVNPSPSDHLVVTVSGIPSGWTVNTAASGGAYDATHGTWTVTLPNGVNFSGGPVLTPPTWNSADLTGLVVTATQTDGTVSASVTGLENVTIIPVADPVPIVTHDASGLENSTIGISVSLNLPQGVLDGADNITSVVIGGVPAGATLNHGTLESNGTWLLTPADLTGLTITPVHNVSGTIPLTVTVTDTDTTLSGHTATAVTTGSLNVGVNCFQPPVIEVTANCQGGSVEDQTYSHPFSDCAAFPVLQEGVALKDTAALGILASDLSIGNENSGTVQWVSEGAGYKNTLGYYDVDPTTGAISNVHVIWADATDQTTAANYTLSNIAETQLGFFVVADGYITNNAYAGMDFSKGTLSFIYDYGQSDQRVATINDTASHLSLVYTDTSGHATVIEGPIYQATDRGDATAPINPDGDVHVVSGLETAGNANTLEIGFEDLPNLGDKDYNDIVFSVTINPTTTQTLTPAAASTAVNITDADTGVMSAATVAITHGQQTGDQLALGSAYSVHASGEIFSGATDTGVHLTATAGGFALSGNASIATYDGILNSVVFSSTSTDVQPGSRELDYTVTDSNGLSSNVGQSTFTVNAAGVGTAANTYTITNVNDVDTIAHFSVANGDTLDLHDVLAAYDPLTEALHNFVNVTTSGSNTIVQVDPTGSGSAFHTVAVLEGVTTDLATLQAHAHLVT